MIGTWKGFSLKGSKLFCCFMYTGAIFLVCFHTLTFEGNYSNEKHCVQAGAAQTPFRHLSLKESWVGALLYGIAYPFIYGNQTLLDSSKTKFTIFFFQSGSRTAILQNSEHILSLLLLWRFTDRRLYRVDINKVCLNVKTFVIELSTGKKDRWSWMQNYITIDVL